MTDKLNELEGLELDLDSGFETVKTTTESSTESIDDLDLDIGDIETPVPPKDELKTELTNIPPKDDLSNINLDEPISSEKKDSEIEINLDDIDPIVETPKPEVKVEVKNAVADDIVKQETKTDTVTGDGTGKPLEDINLDIDVTPEVPPVQPPVAEVSQKPELEINLDIDESGPVKEEGKPVEEKKKKGRKPKVEKEKNIEGLKNQKKQYSGIYDPVFDMSKIKLGKYNIRHTKRTPEEINELALDIKKRGQLEPLHVVKEGEEYHLIAGYGRHEAMASIGTVQCRVIYYENITQEDIFTIATGTNQKRTDLTAWDNIVSIVKFRELHKDVPVTSEDENELSICSIFGIGKSTAYSYIDLFEFFKEKTPYIDFLKTTKIPYHILLSIFEQRANIRKHEDVVEFVKTTVDTNRKEFKEKLELFISEMNMSSDIDIGDVSISPEVDNVGLNSIAKEAATIAENLSVEEVRKLNETTAKVNEIIAKAIVGMETAQSLMLDSLAIEHSINLISPEHKTKISQLTKKLTEYVSKFTI